ncbi:MAG: arlR [Sphingomonas bacterium]|nr:arlR [Sphingomonas bacterium]
MRQGLEAEGHRVLVAGTGPEGFARASERRFDLIILDVMLPGYSGRELCRRMRTSGDQTPIMMLTALDDVAEKVECLRGGADDYLVKPFDFDELTARIDALVRRGQGRGEEAPTRIEAAGVTIDLLARTVALQGEEIDFTARELQLLETLMSSPDRVLSRTRLLNKVWGYDADPMTNVVDVYIKRIRTKLGFHPDTGPIRTVRGYGYRFCEEPRAQ